MELWFLRPVENRAQISFDGQDELRTDNIGMGLPGAIGYVVSFSFILLQISQQKASPC